MATETLSYFYIDNLNSRIVETTSSGFVQENTRVKYSAWGEVESDIAIKKEYESFTGKQMDASGLYYFNARYYDPETARFITEDPAKQGLGWYNYCNNNPINKIDPDGRDPRVPGLDTYNEHSLNSSSTNDFIPSSSFVNEYDKVVGYFEGDRLDTGKIPSNWEQFRISISIVGAFATANGMWGLVEKIGFAGLVSYQLDPDVTDQEAIVAAGAYLGGEILGEIIGKVTTKALNKFIASRTSKALANKIGSMTRSERLAYVRQTADVMEEVVDRIPEVDPVIGRVHDLKAEQTRIIRELGGLLNDSDSFNRMGMLDNRLGLTNEPLGDTIVPLKGHVPFRPYWSYPASVQITGTNALMLNSFDELITEFVQNSIELENILNSIH